MHRMLAGMDLDADLALVACPVLVLAGDTDQTRPAALVRAVAARIPGAHFAEVASGHVMPMLTPGLVACRLEAFLRTSTWPPTVVKKAASVEPADHAADGRSR